MRRIAIAAAAFTGLFATGLAAQGPAERDGSTCESCKPLLERALEHPSRSEDRARDQYRHPVETLEFFRVEPGMKVGEFAPGGGWYSRVIGNYLDEDGKLVGIFFDPSKMPIPEDRRQGIRDSAAKFAAGAAGWTGLPESRFAGMTTEKIPDAEKGTFDRVLVIRMMHNMFRWNTADSEIAAMRELLKDDGLLGIVQHRAKAEAPWSYANGTKGYLRQADVVKFMEVNGFELVDSAEINANPADDADWPGGVWTLPPTLSQKETARERYEAIGESDRMTLLFRKAP
ncbi:class I SAM-dependent methyltransferase [Novosphingobium marinum]|nr:class I SAM-dependent methyltransferase [Novosphingobium marinum]